MYYVWIQELRIEIPIECSMEAVPAEFEVCDKHMKVFAIYSCPNQQLDTDGLARIGTVTWSGVILVANIRHAVVEKRITRVRHFIDMCQKP